jgi:hypothetical protein
MIERGNVIPTGSSQCFWLRRLKVSFLYLSILSLLFCYICTSFEAFRSSSHQPLNKQDGKRSLVSRPQHFVSRLCESPVDRFRYSPVYSVRFPLPLPLQDSIWIVITELTTAVNSHSSQPSDAPLLSSSAVSERVMAPRSQVLGSWRLAYCTLIK